MERYAGAEAFVEVLNARGVEYIFFNPGIDTVPVQVTISRFKELGKTAPGLVLCLDESVAMAAAQGHYMVSGRPQAVMVHRELGTLQVGGQLHNAYFGRVPVILCAGLLPLNKRQTWQQKPYDQGSMVRNCVKWDYEVKGNDSIAEISQKAVDIAYSEPYGPVYLAPTWEIMAESARESSASQAEKPAPSLPKIDRTAVSAAADLLMSAKNPLILAGHSGRHHESVAALVKLAESIGARVLTSQVRVNFPTSHPLCAGMDPIGGGNRTGGHYITGADLVLLVDYDLPYAAGGFKPAPGARVISIDIDPFKKEAPLWDRQPDIFFEADCRQALEALNGDIARKMTPARQVQYCERASQYAAEHLKIRSERQSLAAAKSQQKPITADWLSYCLAQVVKDDTIIVNQTITHSGFVGEQIYRTQPGTFLSCAGGSIGWALGAALGAKLAARDKTVVSLMGDGAYVWGCPVATLWSARTYQAPFLSVVFNNQAYAAIKGLVQRAYGTDPLSAQRGREAGVDINPPPDYAAVARACGAFGLTVEEPEEVLPALKQALEEVRAGKAAVLDVRLA
jgi:acetolactate synthase I/II/III large subunit